MSHRILIDTAQDFFSQLAENNNRDWFTPRKGEYDKTIAAPAKVLAADIAAGLTQIMGTQYRPKIFRIHRDVRFSKDKSPYKAHLHMSFTDVRELEKQNKFDQQNDYPHFFCGINPGGLENQDERFVIKAPSLWFMIAFLGFNKAQLETYRAFIDARGDDLQSLINAAGAQTANFGANAYKRVPAPYRADHPHQELLRRKSLVVSRNLQADFEKGDEPLALILDQARALKPIGQLMTSALR